MADRRLSLHCWFGENAEPSDLRATELALTVLKICSLALGVFTIHCKENGMTANRSRGLITISTSLLGSGAGRDSNWKSQSHFISCD